MAGWQVFSTDEFDLVSIEYDKDGDNKVKTALVDAVHKGKSYRITLTQPFGSDMIAYGLLIMLPPILLRSTVQYENGKGIFMDWLKK